MAQVIDKNLSLTLPLQVRNILAKRIESAYYQPGRKIDSIRRLSNEFNVSTVTVIEAMKLLEDEGYVVRIPASGIFVNEKFATIRKLVEIALAFPEKSISPEVMALESWALNSEIYRGLLEGAQKFGARIHFEYFPDNVPDIELHSQLKRLRQYDAAIFVGSQLAALQREFAQSNPVFQISSSDSSRPEFPIVKVDYDRLDALRQLALHAVDCGYKTLGIVNFSSQSTYLQERGNRFRAICGMLGREIPEEMNWMFEGSSAEINRNLCRKLSGPLPDAFFCNHAEFIFDFYEAAHECGIKIGKDVGVFGIASGWTYRGLMPTLTYMKVPMYEIAQNIVQGITSTVAAKEPVLFLPPIKAKLIQGRSTQLT